MGRDGDVFESCGAEAIASPLGQLAVARGTGHVRFVGEEQVRVADLVCRRHHEKALFDFGLAGRARPREAERSGDRPLPGRSRQRGGCHGQRGAETHAPCHFFRSLRISLEAF